MFGACGVFVWVVWEIYRSDEMREMNLVCFASGLTGGFRARNVEKRCRRVCVVSSRVSELEVGGSAVSEDGVEERGVFPGQVLVEKEL